MSLTIHHLHLSVSERLIWLCEELSIPYTLIRYPRSTSTSLAPPSYKSLSPTQTSPVITSLHPVTHHTTTLSESAACVEYIIQTFYPGGLSKCPLWIQPEDAENYPEFLFWWHYGQASLASSMMQYLTSRGSPPGPMTSFVESRFEIATGLLNERLGKSRFLAGEEFTVADLMALFHFTTARVFSRLVLREEWGNVRRWVKECGGREAYRRAMEKGDPGFKPVLGAKL